MILDPKVPVQPNHENLPPHPVEADKKIVSILFLITSETGQIESAQLSSDKQWLISLPLDAHVVVFSDRPHRIAKKMSDINKFVEFFLHSDLTTDPPNVTIAGNLNSDLKEYYSIVEIGKPAIQNNEIKLPIIKPIGEEEIMPEGSYSNLSLVVDSVWGWVWGGLEVAAAGTATAVACTVGEVVTMGADTAVCVAGVAGTTGLTGNVIRDNT